MANEPAEQYERRTPRCQCPDCLDDEEAGCAVTMYAAPGGELVQCGLPGGHEGSCDYWERPHKARRSLLGTKGGLTDGD